jgi:hypothetical protein
MKVKFSKTLLFVPLFNGNQSQPEGDQLKYELTPMELSDFYDVLDKLAGLKGAKKDDGTIVVDPNSLSATSQKDFMQVCQGFLTKYVKSVGAKLEDADGNEITVEDIAKYSPFITLLSEFTAKLLEISTPTELELGN